MGRKFGVEEDPQTSAGGINTGAIFGFRREAIDAPESSRLGPATVTIGEGSKIIVADVLADGETLRVPVKAGKRVRPSPSHVLISLEDGSLFVKYDWTWTRAGLVRYAPRPGGVGASVIQWKRELLGAGKGDVVLFKDGNMENLTRSNLVITDQAGARESSTKRRQEEALAESSGMPLKESRLKSGRPKKATRKAKPAPKPEPEAPEGVEGPRVWATELQLAREVVERVKSDAEADEIGVDMLAIRSIVKGLALLGQDVGRIRRVFSYSLALSGVTASEVVR